MEQNKKYQIIYADPAWSYQNSKVPQAGVDAQYKTMSLEDIKNLPVQEIADDNCVLFMWVTFPMLLEGLEVINSWGFKYKTLGFSWIKTNPKNGKPFFGVGYYAKSNCEVCLMATKGKVHPMVISNMVSSCIISRRREHSRKPDEVRNKIVELFGDLPRVELFARQKVEGWDVWGNEVDSDIII
jgi:N6-adenosine-specific RNA methylase IME4